MRRKTREIRPPAAARRRAPAPGWVVEPPAGARPTSSPAGALAADGAPGTPPSSRPPVEGLRSRQLFSRLSPRDLELLRGLREELDRSLAGIIERFYRHLLQFEPMRALLLEDGTIPRLQEQQRRYLRSLTGGKLDEAYVEDRLRIGRTHERIGLQPQWYLGASSILLDELAPVVRRRYADDPAIASQALAALGKIMNLDAQIVLDAYFEAGKQRAVARSEQLAAVGELAASIAHEVRNPLAGMKGALEVLRRSLPDRDSRRQVMQEVVAQIDRLEGLVRDLLSFARPNPMSRRPVRMEDLLDRAVRLLQDGQQLDGIRIERRYQSGLPQVSGDEQQLEQVFINLIHNAAHAMDGDGTLTLDLAVEEGTTTIRVSDTGKGIPPENLAQIFQPFFTTKHRGSGLGLSIVRKIIEAHGGTVRVESEPGVGTTAVVTLPREEAQ